MKLDVKSMCLCSLFSILIAIGAFIRLPISIVPVTMQTLFVILAGMVLGKRNAFISVCLYLMVGFIGLPVFANGGGIAYVLQPSFGYLMGFVLAAYLVGYFHHKNINLIQQIFIAILAMLIIYTVGIVYFAFIQHFYYGLDFTLTWLFYYLFIVYLPGDTLACIIAVWVGRRLKQILYHS